jgi:hypothetical protein
VVGGDRRRNRLLFGGAIAEIAECEHSHRRVPRFHREHRRRRAQERRQHRAPFEGEPALLSLSEPGDRGRVGATLDRGRQASVEECVELAHATAAQHFERRQRHRRIGIARDHAFDE